MAEALFKQILEKNRSLRTRRIVVSSAGTNTLNGLSISRDAIEVMKRKGLDLTGFRSTKLTPALVNEADLILTMEKKHKKAVIEMAPKAKHKTFTLKEFNGNPSNQDIKDPTGKGIARHEACLEEIERNLFKAVERLNVR